MGKTYRKHPDEDGRQRKPKHHTSGKRTGGMKIVNGYYDEDDDDFFDDEVGIEDHIVTELTSDDRI
jgi:hypothetical protein